MKNKLFIVLVLCCSAICYGQLTCPTLTSPMNGDTNVPVDATINWNPVVGAPGYLISIGTTPGGTDILNNQNAGNGASFQPPLGLPDNSDIYVTITIFFFNQANIVCTTEMFRTEDVIEPPDCTTISFPSDGAENINVGTSISWEHVPTATGYQLSLGTSPGGTDILNNENILGALTYQPTMDLPVDTEIFVTLIPFNENGSASGPCQEYSFTTGALATIPGCASLISPVNSEINVPLSPILEWTDVPDATGYRVTIGTTPFNSNVLQNVVFTETSTVVIDFEPNLTFFVTITPFNAAGDAIGCQQESFSTILGCGPFFDAISNQFIDLRPEINFPDTVSFCQNDSPLVVTSEDAAEGFRWYQIDQFDNEQFIASGREVELNEPGRYRYEAYNTIMQSGNAVECTISKVFEVVFSEIAVIDKLNIRSQNGTFDVTVEVSGTGSYEFALDNINGPYQDSSDFQNIQSGLHTFYVRDKNGCGITERTFSQDITVEGFPNFFTPNGDGINDFWQFVPPVGGELVEIGSIFIFDRFGTLLRQINPNSQGWDGNFNGTPLPASDYWFTAIIENQKPVRGHFSLKR